MVTPEPIIHEATSENPDPAEFMPVEVNSAFPAGAKSNLNAQEKAQIDKFIEAVPDKNDTRAINYWVDMGDNKVYLEGWIDQCLTGTGFPSMEGGEWDSKIPYMIRLTHRTLIEKQEERNRPNVGQGHFPLIEGGFREFEAGDREWLYGVTWGVYSPMLTASTHPLVLERFSHSHLEQEDLISMGKKLEKYIPGFTVHVFCYPHETRISKYSQDIAVIDDVKKAVIIGLWHDDTFEDVLAILAHERAHLIKGTAKVEKGLSEIDVWKRGEKFAREWGILPQYFKFAQELAQYYSEHGAYPRIVKGIREWLKSRSVASTYPLVLEQFPHPGPEEMELGGDIGKIKITIPPPRGAPAPPKKVGVTIAPEAPLVLTIKAYDRDWKPKGWKLLAIGPTSTWRQDWGIWEAIRDIVQNALDETESYKWGYDDQGLWISDDGQGVAVADFLLGPPKLKPEYARGRYGEGMKISTLVLVRNGFPVHIITVGKELWIVFLELDIDGVKTHQLNALYKAGGFSHGTKFHIIGYTGPAYADRFAVNIPKDDILWQGPSLITKPKQRFNMLYPSHFPISEGAGAGRIFARDIYLRDINSPYSYNLWSFDLAPDRHAPVNEGDVWLDVGRLWATVSDPDLLEVFLRMVKDPPEIVAEESHHVNMSGWEMGMDPVSGKRYDDIIKDNAKAWQKAWNNVFGEDAIIRTTEKLDNTIEHLGYKSTSLLYSVKAALSQVIDTDQVIRDISQEKLRETEVFPDEELDSRQAAHIKLARAIAREVFRVNPVSGVYAAFIPRASDRVRTAGMYGTTSQAIYISLDILFFGRDTIDTLIHELAHHKQWRLTGEAEDLTESHAAAMTSIAATVITDLSQGKFTEELKEVSW